MEIGTEEIPAAYLDGLIAQLQHEVERTFDGAHIAHGKIDSSGTPRRLVLILRGVASHQALPAEEIRGPSKQTAYDANGAPTPALQGFLKSRGGTLSQTKLVETGKGAYVYLVKPARHVPTTTVMPKLITLLIYRLKAPKTMRWDDSGFRFARPVRWLLVLYGSTVVRVNVGRLTSGHVTWIGGPKRPKAVAVGSLAAYHAALKRDGVILDQRARRQRIDQLVRSAAKEVGGIAAPEMVTHGLCDEVTNLTERPVALVGRFDSTYLRLPREVLLASMAKHQRVFAVQSSSGRLLPVFIGIMDGQPGKPAVVRAVMEHILNARLADAKLFWEQDQSVPLEARDLSAITFHEKLGSMADKTKRLEALVTTIAKEWRLDPPKPDQLLQAAKLAKADLTTNLVREFPTLQGVMGKYYALKEGVLPIVAQALEQQYWLGELREIERHINARKMPGGDVGAGLMLAERFDTLASYFGIGIEPTGTTDPFGLRRCAQAIVELAAQTPHSIRMSALFKARTAFPPFASMNETDKQRVLSRTMTYIYQRFYSVPWDSDGAGRDVIDAVLSGNPDDLVDAGKRIEALAQLNSLSRRGDARLVKAAKVVERTANILKGAPPTPADGVDPARFQNPLEHRLWETYGAHREAFTDLAKKQAYVEATQRYGDAFYDVLHEFFDHVMVNVKEESIQQNRLALMRAINTLYTDQIADLSKLALLEEAKT